MLEKEEIFRNWKDRELIDLIVEYYKIVDFSHERGLQQILEELQAIKDYVKERKFKKFVELGSDEGGTLWIYTNLFCNESSQIFSVDTRGSPALLAVVDRLKEKGYNITRIQRQSDDAEALNIVGDGIDFLHQDADHAYDSIMIEWKLYYPKLENNTMFLTHDTLLHGGPIAFREYLENNGFNPTTFKGEIPLAKGVIGPITTGLTMLEIIK